MFLIVWNHRSIQQRKPGTMTRVFQDCVPSSLVKHQPIQLTAAASSVGWDIFLTEIFSWVVTCRWILTACFNCSFYHKPNPLVCYKIFWVYIQAIWNPTHFHSLVKSKNQLPNNAEFSNLHMKLSSHITWNQVLFLISKSHFPHPLFSQSQPRPCARYPQWWMIIHQETPAKKDVWQGCRIDTNSSFKQGNKC